MKKSILLLSSIPVYRRATFVSLVTVLQEKYHIDVISNEFEDEKAALLNLYKDKDITFLSSVTTKKTLSLWERIIRRISWTFKLPSTFYLEAIRLLNTNHYDLLWVVHEKTAILFKKEILKRHYIFSMYELGDADQKVLSNIEPIVQHADEIIVPEYNRACIMRVWYRLSKTPTVIPNKPVHHFRNRCINNDFSTLFDGKKIILYQGNILRSRNLDKLCEACLDMPEYTLLIMGKGEQSYIDELQSQYPNIIYISFVAPPEHLYITSWAHIGIVKYDWIDLNHLYCAPNKTWEYAGYGIPILGNDIPGLVYTVGHFKAGVLCDMDNVVQIKNAIREIEVNYRVYSENALKFFDSCDPKSAILGAAARNLAD